MPDVKLIALIGKLEAATDETLKLAKCERDKSKQQTRLLAAYALIRRAQDEITMAGANL